MTLEDFQAAELLAVAQYVGAGVVARLVFDAITGIALRFVDLCSAL